MYPNTVSGISDGAVNHDYDMREIGSHSSVRMESAAPLDKPKILAINHRDVGTGVNLVRQSRAKFSKVVENEQGEQGIVSCSVVLSYPLKVATAADVAGTVAETLSFCGKAGYTTQFINGEI